MNTRTRYGSSGLKGYSLRTINSFQDAASKVSAVSIGRGEQIHQGIANGPMVSGPGARARGTAMSSTGVFG